MDYSRRTIQSLMDNSKIRSFRESTSECFYNQRTHSSAIKLRCTLQIGLFLNTLNFPMPILSIISVLFLHFATLLLIPHPQIPFKYISSAKQIISTTVIIFASRLKNYFVHTNNPRLIKPSDQSDVLLGKNTQYLFVTLLFLCNRNFVDILSRAQKHRNIVT